MFARSGLNAALAFVDRHERRLKIRSTYVQHEKIQVPAPPLPISHPVPGGVKRSLDLVVLSIGVIQEKPGFGAW